MPGVYYKAVGFDKKDTAMHLHEDYVGVTSWETHSVSALPFARTHPWFSGIKILGIKY